MSEFISLSDVAYHEAGHLFAEYMLRGNIDRIESVSIEKAGSTYVSNVVYSKGYLNEVKTMAKTKLYPSFYSVEGYQEIFNEICILLGGSVLQRRNHRSKAPITLNAIDEDTDIIRERAYSCWSFPFRTNRKGYLNCSELDHMIIAARDFTRSTLLSFVFPFICGTVRYLQDHRGATRSDLLTVMQSDLAARKKACPEVFRVVRTSPKTRLATSLIA